jgi:uncharacterized protein YndB with AHSA1/START domain
MVSMKEDAAFHALADASRRKLLDRLYRKNGQILGDLCAGLDMTRQALGRSRGGESRFLEAAKPRKTALRQSRCDQRDRRTRVRKFERRHLAALSALKNNWKEKAVTNAGKSSFVYVTYIRTTPERLWSALTSKEFAQQYWLGACPEADWKAGGSWKLMLPDGRVADAGEIVAFEPSKRLSIRWRNERPELKAEGWSLCTMELEPVGVAVKLTVTHSIEREGSKLIDAVSGGWPQVLSNLKSLLETGAVVLGPKYSK